MQNKQDHSSSFSEVNSSEEEIIENSSKNVNNEENEQQNTNFLETKISNFEPDVMTQVKSLTPTNNDAIPSNVKIKQLFLNTSSGNIQNFIPIKKNVNQAFSLDQNLSFLNSMATNSQINQTTNNEETHQGLANTNNNSPMVFNKTMQKFKSFLNNDNDRQKVIEKYQNNNIINNEIANNVPVKRIEKKNLSLLFNKEDKEPEETNYKQTSEALIKKNHQLQIENYNLRRIMISDKNLMNLKIKKIYDLIKNNIDKSIGSKSKFELGDLDFILDILDKKVNQGFQFEMKERILHQFDNLRDYYRVNKNFILFIFQSFYCIYFFMNYCIQEV